jgi:hypothetical protein
MSARLADRAMTFIKNSLLTLASLAFSLVALELGLRLVNGQPLWPDRNLLLERADAVGRNPVAEYEPLVGWVHKPNLSISRDRPQRSFTTGELGIRMNQAEKRPLPRHAILAVGDSFTVGSEVGDAASWPAFLERSLGEPVVNGGTGGWGADQIVLRAEQLISKLMPKLVIASFLEDDISRAGYSIYGGAPKPYFQIENDELVLRNNPVPRISSNVSNELGLLRSILGYSYTVDWAMARLGVIRWFEVRTVAIVENDPASIACRLLERLKRATDANGIRLVFILQWGGNEIAKATSRSLDAVRTLDCAIDAGIQTIDTWDALKQVHAQGEDKLKSLFNMIQNGTLYSHMSPTGNSFIADLLEQAVRDHSFTAAAAQNLESPAPKINRGVLGDAAKHQDLEIVRNAGAGPDGSQTATLLTDNSENYGTIFEDVPVEDDDLVHTISLDLKAGTSPLVQIVMVYLGGQDRTYYAYVETTRMSARGEGTITRKSLGNGWYRITLSGANNHSGNTRVRIQVYPRHGKPEDFGTLHVANARLDPSTH